jgi:hypothetical protein
MFHVTGRPASSFEGGNVGMSSRVRQAYVAAKLYHFGHLTTRAPHSEKRQRPACSSASVLGSGAIITDCTDEQELVPTGQAPIDRPMAASLPTIPCLGRCRDTENQDPAWCLGRAGCGRRRSTECASNASLRKSQRSRTPSIRWR